LEEIEDEQDTRVSVHVRPGVLGLSCQVVEQKRVSFERERGRMKEDEPAARRMLGTSL